MSRKTISISVPYGSVLDTINLGQSIVDRHLELGVASPLKPALINMTDFETLVQDTRNLRNPAKEAEGKKEAWNEQANDQLGIKEGQNSTTPNTIYNDILLSRDFLQALNLGNEENLSLWGFDVVVSMTGGRRNVRIKIPYRSPEGLLELATAILSKHATDGVNSPLLNHTKLNIAGFTTRINTANTLREDADEQDENKQADNQQARTLCGYSEGQSSVTPGTLIFFIAKIRDLLLTLYDGNEQQLETFGFKVVTGTAKMPTTPPAPPEG